MKFAALLFALTLAVSAAAWAQEKKGGFTPLTPGMKEATAAKPLEAILTATPEGKAAETFKTTQPTIYLLWKGETLKKGDKLRAVWIAEDVGEAAAKNTKIDEYSIEAPGPKSEGTMSLSSPEKGWPVGTYRVDFFVGDELKLKLPFTIRE